MIYKDISVLIPTKSRADLLRVCLESVLNAGIPFREILVGDDGGDADTIALCEEFSERVSLRRLPPRREGGSLATNLNRLVTEARGEWCYLIHDDDFVCVDLKQVIDQAEPDVDFIFTDHWVASADGEIDPIGTKINSQNYSRDRLKPGIQGEMLALVKNQSFCLDGFFAKAELLRRIAPDPSHGGNADYFWLSAILLSEPAISAIYLPTKSFAYRLNPVGITGSGFAKTDLILGYRSLENKTKAGSSFFRNRADDLCVRLAAETVMQLQFLTALSWLHAGGWAALLRVVTRRIAMIRHRSGS